MIACVDYSPLASHPLITAALVIVPMLGLAIWLTRDWRAERREDREWHDNVRRVKEYEERTRREAEPIRREANMRVFGTPEHPMERDI